MKRNYGLLVRVYLDLQHLRIAVENRMKKLGAEEEDFEAWRIMSSLANRLKDEETRWLLQFKELVKEHPIWDYCEKVKGLGAVGALTFLGWIDPHKAVSAGRVWSYFGFAPKQALKSGEKANYNPEATGRACLLTRNVIMAKDPYYTPLYQQKKAHYMEKMGKFIDNPELCPDYEKCKRRLYAKAKRLGRKPKRFPCKAHIDNMAKRWLTKLILSHALEILREAEGLDVSNLRSHRNYIPPPV